jgi:DNA mismatch repair protein MutS
VIADEQTRRDLELFRARDGGPSVIGLMDRTSTREGRRRLETIFQQPIGEAEIRARHDAIRFLAGQGIEPTVRDATVRAVRDYVDSSFVGLTRSRALARRLEALAIALRYRDLAQLARAGVTAVLRLTGEARRLMDGVDRPGAPVGVAALAAGIRSALEALADPAAEAGRGVGRVLEADRVLRGALRPRVQELLEALAELDALCSAARLLDEGYSLPHVATDGTRLAGDGLWHPFLPDGVSNGVNLGDGATLLFLTGPNMAGKTTYLKSVGVALYLAHCGLPVPAEGLTFSVMDRLVTGLAPEDNLRRGTSYFLAEVQRVRDAVSAVAAGERTVALFDEVFRGTNVTDALEASTAVLAGCARAAGSLFLVSSHLVELAAELDQHPAIRFRCFEGELETDGIRFDYRLRNGVSRQRLGMELLRREGIPSLLDAIPE